MTQVDFYDKEQIDAKEIGAPDDAASESGSLWARIKNAVARIISLETADTDNVKKTGTSTVTGTLEVPTIPPTPTSVVNSVYVNDATDGVNNIMHKTGDETVNGMKTMIAPIVMKANPIISLPDNTTWSRDTTPSGVITRDIRVLDSDGNDFMQLRFRVGTDNKRSLRILIWNPNTQIFDTITLAETSP